MKLITKLRKAPAQYRHVLHSSSWGEYVWLTDVTIQLLLQLHDYHYTSSSQAPIPGFVTRTLPDSWELAPNVWIHHRNFNHLSKESSSFFQHLPPWWVWCWECPGRSTPDLWQYVLSSWQSRWKLQPDCCVGGWFVPRMSASQHKTIKTWAWWVVWCWGSIFICQRSFRP